MQVEQNKKNIGMVASEVALQSLAGGLIAQSVHELRMPQEVRLGMRNSKLSQDQFVSAVKEAAEETARKMAEIRAAEKAKRVATGMPYINISPEINIEEAVAKAKEAYPSLMEKAKAGKKALAKTFLIGTATVAAIKIAAEFVKAQKAKAKKSQQ